MSRQWVVYFIQVKLPDGHGPVKVGVTSNIETRLTELQVASAWELVVRAAIPAYSRRVANWAERYVHDRLRRQRMRGEWFEDDPEVWQCMDDCEADGIAGMGYIDR